MKIRTFKNKAELITALMNGEKWDMGGVDGYCMYDESYSSPFRYVSRESNISMENTWYYCDGKIEWQQVEDEIKHWEPKIGDVYFAVQASVKGVFSNTICTGMWEKNYSNLGLLFKTQEECEKKLNYMLTETTLRKRIWELNGGEECPFVYNKHNFSVGLDDKHLTTAVYTCIKHYPNWFYCRNADVAKQLIKEMSDELQTYLNY